MLRSQTWKQLRMKKKKKKTLRLLFAALTSILSVPCQPGWSGPQSWTGTRLLCTFVNPNISSGPLFSTGSTSQFHPLSSLLSPLICFSLCKPRPLSYHVGAGVKGLWPYSQERRRSVGGEASAVCSGLLDRRPVTGWSEDDSMAVLVLCKINLEINVTTQSSRFLPRRSICWRTGTADARPPECSACLCVAAKVTQQHTFNHVSTVKSNLLWVVDCIDCRSQ